MTNVIVPMALRLPLCPSCGDTKHVVDDPTLAVRADRHRVCTACNVAWSSSGKVATIRTEKNEYIIRCPLEMPIIEMDANLEKYAGIYGDQHRSNIVGYLSLYAHWGLAAAEPPVSMDDFVRDRVDYNSRPVGSR